MSIETQEDWWALLTENEERILAIIAGYHPARYRGASSEDEDVGLPITAPTAERACHTARKQIAKEEKDLDHPVVRFKTAVEEKDHKTLNSLLNGAWMGVPESTNCWSIPGFGALCDLCSESWVFEEEGDV